MLAHTKKRPTKQQDDVISIRHGRTLYLFPKSVAEKYRVSDDTDTSSTVNTKNVFAKINQKYTKPGALLRGIRVRENLTQIEMAKKIKVTQSDISQMENGTRKIGRIVAKRIEKLFSVDYRSFLE
jgi:DNA-binding XRE family transcriptional regulator